MSPITLPDDERTTAVRQLIDRCDFKVVRLYVESPRTTIRAAFVVDLSIRLEQVAVVAASGDDTTMRKLMTGGLVQRIDDLSLIADDTQCHVIYIEPAYLIQIIES